MTWNPRNLLGLCLVGAALAAAPAALAGSSYPGTYQGEPRGVRVTVEVDDRGTGVLRYALKTNCGKARGKISLKPAPSGFQGRRISRGPQATLRTNVAKLSPRGDGTVLAGTLSDSLRGGDSKLSGCASKRRFTAELAKTDAYIPARDAGHYAGEGADGLPISFDLVVDEATGESRFENLTADVEADCTESDDFADEFTMVTHISGLEGRIGKDGSVFTTFEPDENSEYDVDGTIGAARADLELAVSGAFDANGMPDPQGELTCDSWGAPYEATLQHR